MYTNYKDTLLPLELCGQNRLVFKILLLYFCNFNVAGFQDSLKSLDALTPYKFDLPTDLAVRQFQNIKDVFT